MKKQEILGIYNYIQSTKNKQININASPFAKNVVKCILSGCCHHQYDVSHVINLLYKLDGKTSAKKRKKKKSALESE